MSVFKNKKIAYAIALLLAAINDAIDIMDLVQPLETGLDLLFAILILNILPGKKRFEDFITAVVDAMPLLDIVPFWTLYVLYRMREEPEFKERFEKVAPEKIKREKKR